MPPRHRILPTAALAFPRLLALSLFLLVTPPAAAQDDAIVVTAVPKDREELDHAATAFVARVSLIAEKPQLARRTKTYCPKIMGLEDRYLPVVLERVRDAAQAADVTERPAGCQSDLLIIFTTDGDALTQALRVARPNSFTRIHPEKARELFNSGRAIRWWYGTQQQFKQGEKPDEGVRASRGTGSLISTSLKLYLSGTVVIIDVGKSDGYPLDAIASYAAMVSFAEVNGKDATLGETPSVLGMFARSGPRADALRELTAWDRAYLHGLYRLRMDRPSDKQRRELAGLMRDSLLP